MATSVAWHEGHLVALDLETTGVDVHTDRIITAAVVHLAPGQRPRALTWVIDPGVPIAPEASAVNGWTAERIREHIGHDTYTAACISSGSTTRMARSDALFAIAGQVALAMSQKVPVVAFNAAFDLSMLQAECVRHEVSSLTERLPTGLSGVVDPFVIDKHYSRRKGSRRLGDQVTHYQVMLPAAHDASSDALAAARLVPRLAAAYPELARRPLSWLHQQQIAWRAAQQDSLRSYFDRMGKQHDGCCGSWPLHLGCCAPVAPARAVA